jgi:transposase
MTLKAPYGTRSANQVWAFPEKLKRAATISRFPAVKIFKNEIFEKREIVAVRFSFWGNAHTRLALRAP